MLTALYEGTFDALQERLEHERVNNSALKREFNLESMIRKRLIRYDQEEADDMRAIIWSQHIEVISILLKIMSKFQAQLPGMFLDCENPEENMRYSSPAIRKRDMCRTFQHRKESQEFEYDSHPVVKWSTSSSKVDLRYENISWLITTRAPLVQALGEYNRELFDGSIDRSLFKLRKIRVKFLEILRDFLSPVEETSHWSAQ